MLLSARLTLGQLSAAQNDATVDRLHADNQFFLRVTPRAEEAAGMAALNASDTPADGQKPACPLDIQLAWSAKVGSSVYSTPVIAQAGVGRTVLSSTFVRYIEAVSGADGHELPGWPYAFSRSSFHSSPLLLDVDRDGTDELLLVSYDAELIVLGANGLPRRGWSSRLPKLRVKKGWFEGLHDVHTTPRERPGHLGLVHHDDDSPEAEGAEGEADPDADADADGEGGVPTADGFAADVGAHGALTPEAEASFSLFAADAADDDALSGGEAMEEDAGEEEEPRLRRWVELYEAEEVVRRADEQGQVLVDAHVLATPTLADVDGDGELDLVLAVSYFIEEESAARLARHGVVLDRGKYVAGGVVVVDPRSGGVKWSVHLDLTTEETKLRAYIYSSPAVADLDGDGTMEVAVGTSMGFVYVLAGRDGRLREGFPVQMNEIQAALVTADVDGDGFLEILAADAVGSVAAWGHRGSSVWEVQTSGLCAQGLTLAALHGDGALQVVVPTTAGLVHVLDGRTGREARPFPVRTEGQILAAALAVPLLTARGALEPHLVVSSFDGFVYVVNARTGCAHRLDVGEHAYTQVLADDLTGNGKLDLLLGTMNGNLYGFETSTPHSPLRSWRSQAQGRNVFHMREGYLGVSIDGEHGRHAQRRVDGASFLLGFTVLDRRPPVVAARAGPSASEALRPPPRPPPRVYRVVVRVGQRPPLFSANYTEAGPKRERISCPPDVIQNAVLTLTMTNEFGHVYEDSIVVTFNHGFQQTLKWLALGPFALTVFAVVAGSLGQRGALPL